MTANSRLAGQLVKAALRLHAKALWNQFAQDDTFAFSIPRHQEPLAGHICGQAGMEFGLVLFCDGLTGVERTFAGGMSHEEKVEAMDQMGLMVSPLRDIPPDLRGLLEEARWRGRREVPAPHLIIKRPGKRARGPRPREIRATLYAVSALLAAHAAGVLEPQRFDAPKGVPLLRLSGPPHDPQYEIGRLVLPRRKREPRRAARPRRRRRQGGEVWSVGLFTLPAGIEGEDRSVRAVLLVEAESGLVLDSGIVLGEGVEEGAALVVGYADGRRKERAPALPREIRCLDRALCERLQLAFEARGVECIHDPDQPGLEGIAADLREHLAQGGAAGGPPDEEWALWHQANDRLVEALAEELRRRKLKPGRALARYFAGGERGRELLDADKDGALMVPFSAWMLHLYRPRRDSETILETTLRRRDLSEEVRALAEELQRARPSLYRVEKTDPPHVLLRDLAGGEGKRVTVYDRGLSATATVGVLLPALVYPAGPFSFLSLIGPPVIPLDAAHAFSYLESIGIEVTPEGLAANPEFGGLLAEWFDRSPRTPPRLVNTDGHSLAWHTADFSLHDPAAALGRLAQLPDIDPDEQGGVYTWFRPEAEDALQPGDTLLGRMEILGDHLVLTCNSAERFEQARGFLEDIPGVAFLGLKVSEFDPATAAADAGIPDVQVPADDLPGIDEPDDVDETEVSPELAEQLLAVLRKMQFDWLDTEIPAFGYKTPRQDCATPEGRRRVAFEIRTMPKPNPCIPDEAFDELRADLLTELGL